MASPTNTYVRRRPNYKREPAVSYTGSADAIDISRGDLHILARSGGVNAATLADPADSDEGRVIWVKNGEAQANTVTITNGLGGSGGSHDIMTFGAAVAANMTLRAYNQKWYLVGSYSVTVA
jgi:hypothetical protein